MNQTKEAKTDNIVLNKTQIKKICTTIILSITFFFIAVFVDDIATLYALCGLFSTPIFCAYLIAKYMFGGEKNQ